MYALKCILMVCNDSHHKGEPIVCPSKPRDTSYDTHPASNTQIYKMAGL